MTRLEPKMTRLVTSLDHTHHSEEAIRDQDGESLNNVSKQIGFDNHKACLTCLIRIGHLHAIGHLQT